MNKKLVTLIASIFLMLTFQAQAQEGKVNHHNHLARAEAGEVSHNKSSTDAVETINLNTASASAISEMLNGVGPAKAAAIVDFRKKNGPFKSLEEVQQVKGIGEKTLVKNQTIIRFD